MVKEEEARFERDVIITETSIDRSIERPYQRSAAWAMVSPSQEGFLEEARQSEKARNRDRKRTRAAVVCEGGLERWMPSESDAVHQIKRIGIRFLIGEGMGWPSKAARM